ncbi:MAG TPA: hypothetical protein VMC85_12295 [Desulfomonilaceae bacterium]|nr:hypothetical protein [Desulfomonilaceae bacterium]
MTGRPSREEFTHPMLDVIPDLNLRKGKILSAEEAVGVIREGKEQGLNHLTHEG